MTHPAQLARRRWCGLGGAVLAGLASPWVHATPRTTSLQLQAGIGLKADSPQGRGLAYFAELVAARSNGSLRIDVHTGGALGDDLTMIERVRSGAQAITCPDSSTLAAKVPGFSVINYPFTFRNEAEADHVLDGPWGSSFLSRLGEHGLVGLSYWENGFRHLTNNRQAIADMSGIGDLRLRTMQNQMLIDSFAALGFEPVPMPFPQVHAALALGQVHGQENPLPTILSSRFYEVQKHLTLSRHVYSAFVLLIGKPAWESLSPDEQALLRRAAIDARDAQRRWNREVAASALEQLKAKGMQVSVLSLHDAERARRRLRPVLEKYHRQVGLSNVVELYVQLSRLRNAQGLLDLPAP